jgi:hypothetical protein
MAMEIKIQLTVSEFKELTTCADWIKIGKILNDSYQRGGWDTKLKE